MLLLMVPFYIKIIFTKATALILLIIVKYVDRKSDIYLEFGSKNDESVDSTGYRLPECACQR